MFRLTAQLTKSLLIVPRFSYHMPPEHSEAHGSPGLIAKRIIKAVHNKLNKIDPERWNGVPISFNTHWRDEAGFTDIETCVHISEALEQQFGIDVKDRHVLISDIETAYYVVTQSHDAL